MTKSKRLAMVKTFTLTTTLRGHVWTLKMYQNGKRRYFRGGRPAPIPRYVWPLREAACRLFKSAIKGTTV